jgi:ABC-type amino acid transport substrate-binding protein
VGYGDKAPSTLAGRTLGVIWMFTSIVIIAGVTGAIASAFTVQSLRTGIENLDDLLRVRTATVSDSTSERFLLDNGARPSTFARVGDALSALEAGEVDALVYDAPALRHRIAAHHAGSLEVLPVEFGEELYAIAVSESSEHLEAINRSLLGFLSRPAWERVQRRYLGE